MIWRGWGASFAKLTPPPYLTYMAGTKMVRNYRTWLLELEEELQEAIRVSENAEWHHEPPGSERLMVYHRLITWVEEIHDRRVQYDNAKSRSSADR